MDVTGDNVRIELNSRTTSQYLLRTGELMGGTVKIHTDPGPEGFPGTWDFKC